MSTPRITTEDAIAGAVNDSPILEARGVTQLYPLPRQGLLEQRAYLSAIESVDFSIKRGESVGLVGESGSGKSTLSRILTGNERPAEGTMYFEGFDVWDADKIRRRHFRRSVQVVLQNPRSSLDPRLRVGKSLLEPLKSLRIECDHDERVRAVLEQVGLGVGALQKYPHEFSGGQLQRIAIARALMPEPKVLIADEPVSALDVSIRAQVLNLLRDLVTDLGLSMVLIAHDLSVVTYSTSRVFVMANGHVVESGSPTLLFSRPTTEPTRMLVDAVLTVDRELDRRSRLLEPPTNAYGPVLDGRFDE